MRLFPHEVQDVEKVLSLLSKQNPSDHEVSACVLFVSELLSTQPVLERMTLTHLCEVLTNLVNLVMIFVDLGS